MKEKLFIDTWGWIAIHNKRETKHAYVNVFYREFRKQGGAVYTTDYILDETLTLLFRRLPFALAREIVTFLDEAIEQGYLNLEWISSERFEAAKKLRLRFKDKPVIWFTDFTSMTVMKELDVKSILTEDDHFMQTGMGFQIRP